MTTENVPFSRYVRAHGLWFHYLEWKNDGPLAVLGHAASFCASIWTPLAQSLIGHGYRVLSIDMRGHGGTGAALDGDYSWRSLGQDMAEIMERLDIRDAVGIGHSYGAVALMLGEAESPGHLRCAFHMEPAFLLRPWQPDELESGLSPMSRQAVRRRVIWDSRQQLFDWYRNKPPFQQWREDYLWAFVDGCTRLRRDGVVELMCSSEVEARIYMNSNLDYHERWDLLRNYRPPTKVLISKPNPRISGTSPEVKRLEEVALNVQIAYVKGATHYFPMEQPEEFERMLLEFISEDESNENVPEAQEVLLLPNSDE